jgi:hypothetical protein
LPWSASRILTAWCCLVVLPDGENQENARPDGKAAAAKADQGNGKFESASPFLIVCYRGCLVHRSTFAQSVQLVARVPARQPVAARARLVPRRAAAARPVGALVTAATTVAGADLAPVRPVAMTATTATTATTTATIPLTCASSAGTAPTRPTALPAPWLLIPALRTVASPAAALAASAGDSLPRTKARGAAGRRCASSSARAPRSGPVVMMDQLCWIEIR